MRYPDFIRDTTPKWELSVFQQVSTSHAPTNINIQTQSGLTAKDLLEKIKILAKVNQLRMEEYFRDYDALKKGVVAMIKFRGILSNLKLDLTEQELVLLEQIYVNQLDHSKVDYIRFLDDINIAFT